MASPSNKDKFEKQSCFIHNNKYDYSLAEYQNSKTKLRIICPEHGSFWKTPSNHLRGQGCPKCAVVSRSEKRTNSITHFLAKAKLTHGNKFDYSMTKYKTSKDSIEIICPIHGSFWQTPSLHYRYGCDKCAREYQNSLQRRSNKEFLTVAKSVHGLKYSYTKSIYQKAHDKIIITCPVHGDFKQTAHSHLRGRGCYACKQGEGHPRFGKPSPGSGYCGRYNGNMFRSLSELFWMLEQEKHNRPFIALDQPGNREKWQVRVTKENGKPSTYCADFFSIDDNEVLDIKPAWRIKKEAFRLRQGKAAYESQGYSFSTPDCNTIGVDYARFDKMVRSDEVFLYPAARKRWAARKKKRGRS